MSGHWGIRIRKTASDPWQRGKQYWRAAPGKPWKPWRDTFPTRAVAEHRLKQLQQRGWMGHVFEIRPLWRERLYGNIVNPADVPAQYRAAYVDTLTRAAKAAKSLDEQWRVNSSFRHRADQQRFWDAYRAGLGPIAARPGSSAHEFGLALDLSDPRGHPIYTNPDRRRALERQGLRQTVASEAWHAERRA
jgi:hypothetical protein